MSQGEHMRLLSALLLAPVWLAAQSAPSAPADTTDKKAVAPPAATVNHLETTLAGFKLSGFAEASYAYSGHSLGDTAIVGRLYDRLQNRLPSTRSPWCSTGRTTRRSS